MICPFCGKFNRQVIQSQKMCSEFKQHEEDLAAARPRMDESQKDALKALLAEQADSDELRPESKKAS